MQSHYIIIRISNLFLYSLFSFVLSLPIKEQQKEKTNDITQVLIVGQMRSGSSFTGEIFNQHPDAFYMYEPLLPLAKSETKDVKSIIRTIKGYPVEGPNVIELLKNLFNCHLPTIPKSVFRSDFMRRSLKADSFRSCFQGNSSNDNWIKCIDDLTNMCNNSSIRAIKTIRLTANTADVLVKHLPNLKVIYLVRDPRAIMESRMRINMVFPENLKVETRDLCQRITSDLDIVYNESFMIVKYEQLAQNPIPVAKDIYSHVRSIISPKVIEWLEKNSACTRSNNPYSTCRDASKTIFKWRDVMDERTVITIDEECFDLYDKCGYMTLTKLLQIK